MFERTPKWSLFKLKRPNSLESLVCYLTSGTCDLTAFDFINMYIIFFFFLKVFGRNHIRDWHVWQHVFHFDIQPA